MSEEFYVYKITNIINNKVYIGTSINPNQRWKAHQNIARSEHRYGKYIYPLYRSMRKHGIDNFIFEIIKKVSSCEEMLDWESKYILEYNSMVNHNGYNQVFDQRDLIGRGRQVAQIDFETFKIVNVFSSIGIAAKALNIASSSNISQCAYGYKGFLIIGGFIWRYLDDEGEIIDNGISLVPDSFKTSSYANNKIYTIIYQVRGYDNKIIKEYSTTKEAYQTICKSTKTRGDARALQLNIRSFKGYYFCTDVNNVPKMKQETLTNGRNIPIYRLNENNELLEVYNSAHEAATKHELPKTSLANVLNKDRLYKGFFWKTD